MTALCSLLGVAELKTGIIKCKTVVVPYWPQKPIWFFGELCEDDALLKDGVPSTLPHHTSCATSDDEAFPVHMVMTILPYQS